MFGWHRRYLLYSVPFFLPQGVAVAGAEREGPFRRWSVPVVCLLFAFGLTVMARLLELPYWENPAYKLGDEFLLATHDAYHWIAGAEGFEFGAGHPMSELVRLVATTLDYSVANAGFWMPPFLGGLLAVAVFLWGWGLGYPYAGLCAGVLTSLSPGFFARTLLGFYDTDLVVLLFTVLLGLVPALWLTPWLTSPWEWICGLFQQERDRRGVGKSAGTDPAPAAGRDGGAGDAPDSGAQAKAGRYRWLYGYVNPRPMQLCLPPHEMQQSMLRWPWLAALILSGLLGYYMQGWHSMLRYLVLLPVVYLPVLILFLGPAGGRRILMRGAFCHALPLVLGWLGVVLALAYSSLLHLRIPRKEAAGNGEKSSPAFSFDGPAELLRIRHVLWRDASLILLWVGLLICMGVINIDVLMNMVVSFKAYVYRGGDVASMTTAVDPLIFPAVTQSIIEVQTVSFGELITYFYPSEIIVFACFAAFVHRLLVSPVMLWFLPTLLLSFFSLKMGGRMTMFGPAGLFLALCMDVGLLLEIVFFRRIAPAISRKSSPAQAPAVRRRQGEAPAVCPVRWWEHPARLCCCLLLTAAMAWQLVAVLPAYTQGPVISKDQAEGLAFIRENTPPESIVWNWWDWGYAVHHFSHRLSIADGARHGGPSLYLPAAVYSTADPRFARQLIKYTASKGNEPGNVFAGLSATEAQALMEELSDKSRPLVEASGKQYMVVSFELLRLGIWVTRYGSWNFVRKEGPGALMNNLSQALEFNLEEGMVQPKDGQPVPAASIDVFDPSAGLIRKSYPRSKGYHFIFNLQSPDPAQVSDLLEHSRIARFWQRELGYFGFTAITNDKMVVDDVYYNTMMVQLLLCPKDDPRFTPYFKLVFNNVYTRVYEVQ